MSYIYFINIAYNWCDPKPLLCEEGTLCETENQGYTCKCHKDFIKVELASLENPYVEKCEQMTNSNLWILIPVILLIVIFIVIAASTLYVIRHKARILKEDFGHFNS